MTRIRRVGLGVVDQGLSSVSNMLFLIAVAREADLQEFGAVSFAYALFVFGLAVQRSSIGTLISLSTGRLATPPMLASLLWAGAVAATGFVLGATIGDGGSAAYYVVLVGCVVVYPQDLLRYSAIAERRVATAVVSDAIWAGVTLALLGASLVGADLPVTVMALVWVVGGAGAALVAIAVPLRGLLIARGQWWREHANELRTLGPDSLIANTAPLLLAATMAQFMALGDVAAVRGTSTLLGPMAMLFSALPVVLLPEMARVLGDDRSRLATAQALVMGALVLAWGGFLALLPAAAGTQVLGETWSSSRAILLWAVLELGLWALATGPIALLGTYRRWRTLLLARISYVVVVASGLAVTIPSGDLGRVMVGMVAASAINLVVLTVAARRVRSPHA